MKKSVIISLLVTCFVFCASEFGAQARWGVMGGVNFSKLENVSFNRSNMTQYHAGLTFQAKLPAGFSIQPSLLYSVKGAKIGGTELEGVGMTNDLTVGYLELPISFQWGPDLLLFRPFLDVTPFIGYGLHNKITSKSVESGEALAEVKNMWSDGSLNRFEYGVGVGVGLEVWKVQVIGRYVWNLGSLYDLSTDLKDSGFSGAVKNAFENKNFGGFMITAAILF